MPGNNYNRIQYVFCSSHCLIINRIKYIKRQFQHFTLIDYKLLTVHGRTRDQKKELSGLASWDHIKAVKYVL